LASSLGVAQDKSGQARHAPTSGAEVGAARTVNADVRRRRSTVMQKEVLLVGQAALGSSNEELGGLLLANFLRQLADRPDRPDHIVFWNTGVRAVVGGSPHIAHLRRLHELGVDILACRTCLEYLDLEEKVVVGRISNMAEIKEILLTKSVLTV
jgi:intracellular sulfur oxidation DsrE/DsrF family protein